MNKSPNVWHLSFNLTEFTPGEVEDITTLSTGMQRDWRQRGFLPKSVKHARFDAFGLVEAWVMKMFADRGAGPARSAAIAPRIATAVVMSALSWRSDAWAGTPPTDIFDAIPPGTRAPTLEEEQDEAYRTREKSAHERLQDRLLGRDPDAVELPRALWENEKRAWVAAKLFHALRIYEKLPSDQVIWWPTDDVEFGSYQNILESRGTAAEDPRDRFDPRFDGAALILDIHSIAANLVRRAPRALLAASVVVSGEAKGDDPSRRRDLGDVSVTYGKVPR